MFETTVAPPTGVKAQVALYFCLALGISWAGWIPYAAQLAGVVHWRWQIPDSIPLFAQYGPLLAAIILTTIDGGASGLGKFLASFVKPRVRWRWYAVPLFLPPVIGAILISLHALLGHPLPPLSSLAGWNIRFAEQLSASLHSSAGISLFLAQSALKGGWQAGLVFAGLAIANGGLSEEPGWRGYALPRLCLGHRPLFAGLWVGLLWGLWHTGPDFWMALFTGHWAGLFLPISYLAGTLPLSVLFTWVFIRSECSLLPVMLFHASHNATLLFLAAVWMPAKPLVSIPEWLAAFYVSALLAIIVGRRSLLAPRR